MILIDYSQIALASIFQFQSDLKKNSTEKEYAINIIRHAILSSLLYYKQKYSNEYGELVICCDDKNYWRKDYFPYYKSNRKKAREKSDLDWYLIFDIISQVKDEIKENFRYKVIQVDKVEADDIVASLCRWTQSNELISGPLFDEKQKVLILSSDGDFKQLQVFDNVKQWSPLLKKYVICNNPKEYLQEHIMKGDSGDGIPNILSKDNAFEDNNYRQPPLTKKRKEKILEGILSDEEQRNWDRNNQLINFDMIPENIYNSIIDQYQQYNNKNDRMKIYNYLLKNRCSLLLERTGDF